MAKRLLNERERISLLLLIFLSGGVFGFVYEELFYLVEAGRLMKRGMTFGPWIPVYGFGALLIILIAGRFKKNPAAVFFISLAASGILEYITGYVLYHGLSLRLWDYNVEKWNYGNIDGYICLRSVLFFGISGLLLVYVIRPFLTFIKERIGLRPFCFTALLLSGLFILDFSVSSFLLWQVKLAAMLRFFV